MPEKRTKTMPTRTAKLKPFPPIKYFGIDITGRCDHGCYYCFQRDRRSNLDMPIKEFKELVYRLKATGIDAGLQLSGGQPFLHPHAFKMVAHAVNVFGPGRVEITSTLEGIPDTVAGAKKFIRRLNGAFLNVSIDREHLRWDTRPELRLDALLQAINAEKYHGRVGIISVARNKREERHPFPNSLRPLFNQLHHPIKVEVRRDFISPGNREYALQRDYWSKLKQGRYLEVVRQFEATWRRKVTGKQPEGPLFPPHPPVFTDAMLSINFLPDGRAMIDTGKGTQDFPQLSIGNWKREPMHEVLGKNFEHKRRTLMEWLGIFPNRDYLSIKESNPTARARRILKKNAIFASTQVKKFDAVLERAKASSRARKQLAETQKEKATMTAPAATK